MSTPTFAELGIPALPLQVLQQRNINIPTPIQHQAIPVVMKGHDVIGLAQTGTGKTLAFTLPTAIKLVQQPGMAIIVVPTRELATQVASVWQWFEKPFKLSTVTIIGGAPMGAQIAALKRNPRVIIATPGRLNDHLRQRTVSLKNVHTVILDEADRMFDMGFAPQIKDILKHVPPVEQRQTLLFSATMPSSIVALVHQNMRTPVSIEVAPSGTTGENIEQEFVVVEAAHKLPAMLEIMEQDRNQTALIFSRTKHSAKKLTQILRDRGYRAEELHSNRSLQQRQKAMSAMKSKRSTILVATDIAARGIDIAHLDLVINYDLPEQAEDYVHRIGRVGRAGRKGKAISLISADQGLLLKRIQRFVTKPMNQLTLSPAIPAATLRMVEDKPRGGRGGYGGRRGGSGGGRGRGGFGGGHGRGTSGFARSRSARSGASSGGPRRHSTIGR